MIEVLFVGVVLALLGATCAAVYHATKQKYVLALQAQEGHADALEAENQHLRAEVRRLSSRPPALDTLAPAAVSVPPSPSVPRVSFMARGSLVPPPPDYLFELPKRVLEARFNPIEPPPFVMKQALLPPPPPMPMGRAVPPPLPSESDWDAPPSTLRSEKCEAIAKSLRPPPQ